MIYSQMNDVSFADSTYSKVEDIQNKLNAVCRESNNANLLHSRYVEIEKEMKTLRQELKFAEREKTQSERTFYTEHFKNLLSQEYGPERGKIFDIIYEKAYENSDHYYYSIESKFSELVDFVNEVRENI